jgi:hypothetical protein
VIFEPTETDVKEETPMDMATSTPFQQAPLKSRAFAVRPTTEVVVHINETLDDAQRQDLMAAVAGVSGVAESEFCPSRFHLMLVAYDPERTSSRAILDQVQRQGLHAQLIGPI